jgi:hypothetical protein
MQKIRKWDIVSLADGSYGQVMEVVTKRPAKILKIKNMTDKRVEYFDESKLILKHQCFGNKLKDLIGIE